MWGEEVENKSCAEEVENMSCVGRVSGEYELRGERKWRQYELCGGEEVENMNCVGERKWRI